jgi:hypothetical protein
MACVNGVKWCPGPAGFGNKCSKCNSSVSPLTGKGVAPLAVSPALKPLTSPQLAVPSAQRVPMAAPTVLLKPKVALPVPEVTTAPAKGAVKVALYRGDTREPGVIKRDGFELWGAAIANVSKAGGIANYLRTACNKYQNGASFADWVRATKDQDRPTISTAFTEDCGGYSSGYIYKIEYDNLVPYDLDLAILPASDTPIKWSNGGLTAYIDGATLAQSRTIVIDLKLGTKEWAFFTKVAPGKITAYKKSGGTFQPMAPVEVKSRKLW